MLVDLSNEEIKLINRWYGWTNDQSSLSPEDIELGKKLKKLFKITKSDDEIEFTSLQFD